MNNKMHKTLSIVKNRATNRKRIVQPIKLTVNKKRVEPNKILAELLEACGIDKHHNLVC